MPRPSIIVLAVASSLAMTAHSMARSETHVSARVVSETVSLRAGSDSTIGVSLTMRPEWHIYGDTYNDTGMTPKFSWTLPTGVTVGDPIFPAPHRHVSPGDILDHIYEGTVTVLFPVQVKASAAIPKDATIGVRVDLLVCSNACVPETVTASMPLSVVPSAAPGETSKDAPLIAGARERLPARVPQHTIVSTSTPTSLTLTMPGASSLTFYPASDIPTPENLLADAVASKDTLTVRFEAPETETESRRVRGVLECAFPGLKNPVFVSINETLPAVKPVSKDGTAVAPSPSKSTPESSSPTQPPQTPRTTTP